MSNFMEIIKKDTKIHDEISQTVEKYNIESISTRSQIVQNALIQSKIFKQAIEIMGDTIHDIDIEIEQRDNKISFPENKIGVTDDKIVEEVNRLYLNKISDKEKNNRIMNRLNKTLNKHNYIKN